MIGLSRQTGDNAPQEKLLKSHMDNNYDDWNFTSQFPSYYAITFFFPYQSLFELLNQMYLKLSSLSHE